MKRYLYISIIGIIIAESMLSTGDIYYGLGIYAINLLTLVILIEFRDISKEMRDIFVGLILISLFRFVNIATPKFFTTTLLLYPIIYGVMLLPIYLSIGQKANIKELGINFDKFNIYFPMSIIIGLIMSIVEYHILSPRLLINGITIYNIILISIVMIMFIGTVEELMYRSILQTRLEKLFGLRYGLLLAASIFGIMHANYGIEEIIFTTAFGIILCYIFQKTRSLPFVIYIRGIENIILFGILPAIL